MADAATERQAADARRRDDAAGRREPERVGRMEEVAPRATALCTHGTTGWIDANAFHAPEIEDDAAVVGAEARHAVRAAAYGEIERVLACVIDGRHHVGDVAGADDERRSTV